MNWTHDFFFDSEEVQLKDAIPFYGVLLSGPVTLIVLALIVY
ncbi:hypothetical protein [Sporosarcina sp. FSL K6-3457]